MLMIQPFKSKSLFPQKTIAFVMVVFAIVFFITPNIVFAQDVTTDIVVERTGLSSQPLSIIIGRIIQVIFGFLGVIFLGIVIYAGFLYMTSGGEPATIEKAKKWILNGVIGLVIMLSAFSITTFIISRLSDATGLPDNGGGFPTEYTPPGYGTNSLGKILQDHYPGIGMTVPRNTVIMVTFKEPISPDSIFATGYQCLDQDKQACTPSVELLDQEISCVCSGELNFDAIKIYRACDTTYQEDAIIPENYSIENASVLSECNTWKGDEPESATDYVSNGILNLSPDFKTFVFNPYGNSDQHLGTATSDITYFTYLTKNITKLGTTQSVFPSSLQEGYRWDFTTNTTLDNTPPYLMSVSPATLNDEGQVVAIANSESFERNKVVIITFNEPVLPPMYLSNIGDVNQEISIVASGENIAGNFIAGSNNYRSIVFKPTASCGVGQPLYNSCGEEMFCLPKNAVIETLIKSVSVANLVEETGPQVVGNFPLGGIVDTAYNTLDTNGKLGVADGLTQGPLDDYRWQFKTSDRFDFIPPKIISTTPVLGADKEAGVTQTSLVTATYDDVINPATATNDNMLISSSGWDVWYTGAMYCPTGQSADNCKKTIIINHGDLPLAQIGKDAPIIYPQITSGVQDDAGNCFNPCSGPSCSDMTAGQSCCVEEETLTSVKVDAESCEY